MVALASHAIILISDEPFRFGGGFPQARARSWLKKKRRSRYLPKQAKDRTAVILGSNVAVEHDITHRRGGVLIYASWHADPPLSLVRRRVLPARLPRGGSYNAHYISKHIHDELRHGLHEHMRV
jgi:hypothetical protein